MKKIILSSHGFEKNVALKQQLFDLLTKPADQLSVVIVTTASVEWKEKNKHAVSAKKSLEEMGFKKVIFLDIEFEDPNKLKEFDVIYINGGNPFYLLDKLRKTGADAIIKQCADKVILVGISGGGVVLGPNISIVDYFDSKLNTVGIQYFAGLGLTDIIMYPHYQEVVEEKIKQFESENNCRVTRLTDKQGLILVGGVAELF
ncbi:MAG: Type 1 glutamine amidotransferase-like domain-containing protein [Patescibacteria group bacterium]|jgi:dipeptidase E